MRKILLLLLFPLNLLAADHILSGPVVTVVSMLGYSPGDRILLTPGIYTSATFTHLVNITITTQSGNDDVFFDGNGVGGSVITMNNNDGVIFEKISGRNLAAGNKYLNIGGGNNQNCTWRKLYGKNILGAFFHFGVNKVYTWGNNASAQMYRCTIDSIYVSGIGQFMTGAFSSIDAGGGPYDVVDSINVTNIYMDSTKNQDQIVGVYVHALLDNIISVSPNQGTPVTDKGFIQCGDGSGGWGNFQGTISRVYINGGRGKICRLHAITWHTGTRDSTIVKNCAKFNTTNYGCIDIYNSVIHGTVAGHTIGASVMIENITGGNMSSVNIFPSAMVFIGPSNAGTTTVRNTLTFHNQIDGNGNIYNSSGGTWVVDTLKNYRYASATAAQLDSSLSMIFGAGNFASYTPLSGSPVVNKGIRVNLFTDYFGVAYLVPPAVGYSQGGSIIPPPCAGCTVATFHRRTKAVNYVNQDADAAKYIDSAGITNQALKDAYNEFADSLKNNTTFNFWTHMLWFHNFMTDAGTGTPALNQMRWNFRNVLTHKLTYNAIANADSSGILGDGTSSYANPSFRQTGFSDKDHNSMGYGSSTNHSRFETDMGVRDFDGGFVVRLLYLTVSNLDYNYSNVADPFDISHTITDSRGILIATRVASNKTVEAQNGVPVDSATTASVNLNAHVDFLILARGNAPADNWSSKKLTFAFASDDSFTDAQILKLSDIINTLLFKQEQALGMPSGTRKMY